MYVCMYAMSAMSAMYLCIYVSIYLCIRVSGGWRKFLYDWYDRTPCASPLRALARPCTFDASRSCSQNPICPEDVIERTCFVLQILRIYLCNVM